MKSHHRQPPQGSFPGFWIEAHRGLSNQQREAFNDWREAMQQRLDEAARHASALAALCEATTAEAHAREHAERLKAIASHFTNTVPVAVRLFGQHAT